MREPRIANFGIFARSLGERAERLCLESYCQRVPPRTCDLLSFLGSAIGVRDRTRVNIRGMNCRMGILSTETAGQRNQASPLTGVNTLGWRLATGGRSPKSAYADVLQPVVIRFQGNCHPVYFSRTARPK